MARKMDSRTYKPGRIGLDGVLGNASNDSTDISTAGFQTLTMYVKYVDGGGTTTALTWTTRCGLPEDTTEYQQTTASVSSGATTWSVRSDSFTLTSAGTSENVSFRYDVTDYDWFKIENLTGTSGTASDTITVTVVLSNPGT